LEKAVKGDIIWPEDRMPGIEADDGGVSKQKQRLLPVLVKDRELTERIKRMASTISKSIVKV